MFGLRIVSSALLAAALLLGCVKTVKEQSFPGLVEQPPITRVAVAPLEISPRLAKLVTRPGETEPRVAAALIGRHLSEAISARGPLVFPPDDFARAIENTDDVRTDRGAPAPRKLAQIANDEFGADAVLLGEVIRFVEREGQARGATRPASVGFRVFLYSAPEGQRLWSGNFDQTQRALTENIFDAGRLPGGGSRWLTAEELARWGAEQTVLVMPLGTSATTRAP